jgi:1,4-dihydroxy-2-naphthoate octaprenyltransferase
MIKTAIAATLALLCISLGAYFLNANKEGWYWFLLVGFLCVCFAMEAWRKNGNN